MFRISVRKVQPTIKLGLASLSRHNNGRYLSASSSSLPSPTWSLAAKVASFEKIVGKDNVLDGTKETTQTTGYLKGARLGRGKALAIVRPTNLRQVPELVEAAVSAGCVVVVQGSNTGLTGGSVPRNQSVTSKGDDEDLRQTVIISMKHLDKIIPIDDGNKVFCLAGVGLASLKNFVSKNFPDRQSHSTLGSNFLNPTTAAGVAFGSGGTQIRKGPSCTQRALYLKVDEDKETGKPVVKVVNTLGIQNFDKQEGEFEYNSDDGGGGLIPTIDSLVDSYDGTQIRNKNNTFFQSNATFGTHDSHVTDYKSTLCSFDPGLTRYNADTKGLDCNRSEGKVLILATVHDTFPSPRRTKSYWVSFDDIETTHRFKTQVCLTDENELPESIEYMDRGCIEVIDRAGRMMGHFIKTFGADSPLVAKAWDVKLQVEALPGMSNVPNLVQYLLNNILPSVLPPVVGEMTRDPKRNHHILTTVGDYAAADDDVNGMDGFEERFEAFLEENRGKMDVYELSKQSEINGVNAFRYIAAAAFETYCVGRGLQGVSIDYALPKNDSNAPPIGSDKPQPTQRMRYSHFACNVVHEDLAYQPGIDTHRAKMDLKHVVDEVCGGRLPSEHGHGTEYVAPEATKKRWMEMDPLNVMNPGVGGLSTKYRYE